MTIEGGFVQPGKGPQGEGRVFEMSEERVTQLTQIVQYLEQQRHDFSNLIKGDAQH
jgi:hypothetical protein